LVTVAHGETKAASAAPAAHEPRAAPAIREDIRSKLQRKEHRPWLLALVWRQSMVRRAGVEDARVRLNPDYVAAVFVTARNQEERAIRTRLDREAALEAEDVNSSESFAWIDGDDSES
jgi:hypothetical protein